MIVWMGAGAGAGAEIIHNAAGRDGTDGGGWVVCLHFHWW